MLVLFLLTLTSSASVLWLASISFVLAAAAVPLTAGLITALFCWRLRSALAERETNSQSSSGAPEGALRNVATAASVVTAEDAAHKTLGYANRARLRIDKRFVAGWALNANPAAGDQWIIGLEDRLERASRSEPSRHGAAADF